MALNRPAFTTMCSIMHWKAGTGMSNSCMIGELTSKTLNWCVHEMSIVELK